MDALPMLASCALDESGLTAQYARYREAGRRAQVVDRDRRRLVVDLDKDLDTMLVEELIAIEKKCCPFFDLQWDPAERRLTVSVAIEEYEPALNAIVFALDLNS